MTSTEPQKGRPLLARRNTFQKMLDLERKNKVHRMQATKSPPPPVPQVRRSSIAKDSHLEGHPALLANQGRAMTNPTLSQTIHHVDLSADRPIKKYVIKAGNAVPQSEVESGNESERSSICHSPGWDDMTGNKKKKEKQAAKEKKKAESKKLETEAKHAARMKNRLSKPPPTNHHRFSHLGAPAPVSRSSSSPAISTMADSSKASPNSEISPPQSGTRSRRGSIDAAFKNLISVTQSIPSLFSKNSHSTTTPPTKTGETPSLTTSGSSGGFIGGLKLRLSEDAQAREKFRQPFTTTKGERTSISDHRTEQEDSIDPTPQDSAGTDAALKSTDQLHRTENVQDSKPKGGAISDEFARTSQQWDKIYADAGKIVRDESKAKPPPAVAVADDNWPPIMQRNIKLGGPARQSMFPAVPNETRKHESPASSRASGRDSSNGPKPRNTRARTSEEVSISSNRESSPRTLDRKTRNREPSVDSRTGRTSAAYVQHQRLLSKDRGLAAFQDEYRDRRSIDSPARQRSPSFHSVKSYASNGISPNPPPKDVNASSKAPEEVANDLAFFSEYYPSTLQLDNPSPSSNAGPLNRDLNESANSAYPKTPIPSPTANSFVSSIFDIRDAGPISKFNTAFPAKEGSILSGRPSKSEIMLGEAFTPQPAPRSPMASSSNLTSPGWSRSGEFSPSLGPRKNAAMQHTRNATDSSEEYSTLDELSNVTTPMASRPHSQKEYFPSVSDLNKPKFPQGSKITPKAIRAKRIPLMSGAIPYDSGLNGSNESWSRTVIPIDGTEDEVHRTPTGYQSPAESSVALAAYPPNLQDAGRSSATVEPAKESKSASALQRQLSMSRSASTPELQDLSFLPALKHQPLTKPAAKKDKGKNVVPRGKQPASARDPESNQVIKPPPIFVPAPKSEGSSPSGYLRDARMSLPSQRTHSNSPKQLRFSGGSSSPMQLPTPGPTPDPIAKMLVVCCSCKYFHDMPSKIYECMAKPDNVVEDKHLGVSGVISTSVKCPWCGHGMSTSCCAGYAAVVYLKERLH